jgi:hypothetical protein
MSACIEIAVLWDVTDILSLGRELPTFPRTHSCSWRQQFTPESSELTRRRHIAEEDGLVTFSVNA